MAERFAFDVAARERAEKMRRGMKLKEYVDLR